MRTVLITIAPLFAFLIVCLNEYSCRNTSYGFMCENFGLDDGMNTSNVTNDTNTMGIIVDINTTNNSTWNLMCPLTNDATLYPNDTSLIIPQLLI